MVDSYLTYILHPEYKLSSDWWIFFWTWLCSSADPGTIVTAAVRLFRTRRKNGRNVFEMLNVLLLQVTSDLRHTRLISAHSSCNP